MTADALAARLPSARRSPRGWLAKCPAHDDRSPSLSVSAGRDGRVLLKCFSGCEVDRVVAALGLELSDLFERRDGRRRTQAHRRASESEIRAALEIETATYRAQCGLADSESLLTPELNAIRRRVGLRLGVNLPALTPEPHEGNFGGRERDGLWKVAFERAAVEVLFERGLGPPFNLDLCPLDRVAAEDRARELFRELVAR